MSVCVKRGLRLVIFTSIAATSLLVYLSHHMYIQAYPRRLLTTVVFPDVVTPAPTQKPRTPDLSVCPQRTGRLGNQMFQYASAYGIARIVNRTFVIPKDDPITNVFGLRSARVIPDRAISCEDWQHVWAKCSACYDKTIYQRIVSKSQHIQLTRYLQSWRYFDDFKTDILQEFSVEKNLSDSAHKILFKASDRFYSKETDVTYIGVHVRRGDIMRLSEFGYNVAPGSYVRHAVSYFRAMFSKPVFIVCSSDLKWVKQEVDYLRDVSIEYVFNKQLPELDLAVLIACNHTIMTVGTFGWWAGYLAGGDVIYYKYPVKEHSRLRIQFDQEFADYFPPYWIGMK